VHLAAVHLLSSLAHVQLHNAQFRHQQQAQLLWCSAYVYKPMGLTNVPAEMRKTTIIKNMKAPSTLYQFLATSIWQNK